MLIVPEALIAQLVTPEDAFAAVEASFAAMARNEARNFPVVREALGEGRQYGFKSGLDRAGGMLGVKAGAPQAKAGERFSVDCAQIGSLQGQLVAEVQEVTA